MISIEISIDVNSSDGAISKSVNLISAFSIKRLSVWLLKIQGAFCRY